jgi:hypothetical protein
MVDSMYPCTESFGKQEIIISKCTEINQASYQIIQRFATSNTILNKQTVSKYSEFEFWS